MSYRDPGLAAERTQLAWRRTGLSFAIGVFTSFRAFSDCATSLGCDRFPGRTVPVSVLILVGGAMFLDAVRRKPSLPADDGDEARSTVRLNDLVPATVGNVLLAIAAAMVVVTNH